MKMITFACMLGLSMCLCAGCSEPPKTSDELLTTNPTDTQNEDAEDVSMPSENKETTEDEDIFKDNTGQVKKIVGKTFSQLLDEGYEYIGYTKISDGFFFSINSENAEPEFMEQLQKMEGITIKDLLDKNIYIGYTLVKDQCIFTAAVGSAQINFQADEAFPILKNYQDRGTYVAVKDLEELHDKTISNITLTQFEYIIRFEDSFNDQFTEDDLDYTLSSGETPEELLKDCVIKECSYKPIPEGLYQ